MSHRAGRITPLMELRRELYGLVADSFIAPCCAAPVLAEIRAANRRGMPAIRARLDAMIYPDLKARAAEIVAAGSAAQVTELAGDVERWENER